MRMSDWSADVCSSDLRAPASAGDPADDFLVDGTGQDHFRDLRGFLVGDAQAADELRFDAQFLQHRADLRPAAMDDDDIAADRIHQHPEFGRASCRERVYMYVSNSVGAVSLKQKTLKTRK